MPRFVLLAGLAVFIVGAAGASAQETGGVALSPEVMATPNAQGKVLDHVLARAQALQQLRALSQGTASSSNLASPANPAAATSGTPQVLANAGNVLALAQSLRNGLSNSGAPVVQQEFVSTTQNTTQNTTQSLTINNPLTVNALGSPVVLGNNNVVKQQVTNSTAITSNGNATAVAGAVIGGQPVRSGRKGASQTALSAATSFGGAAQATSSNTEIGAR